MKGRPRVKVPDTIKPGETIEVRALVRHPMERGERKDAQGKTIPRNIITNFKAELDGREILSAEFGTGVSKNPFLAFYVTVNQPGTLKLTWIDDQGLVVETERALNVTS